MIKKILCVFFLFPCLVLAQEHAVYRTFGPTENCDDLWKVAVLATENQSIMPQQAEIAIWQKNKQAFEEDNINGLKKNTVLQMPTLEEMQNISLETAINDIVQQNKIWQEPTKKADELTYPNEMMCPNNLDEMRKRMHLPGSFKSKQVKVSALKQQVSALQDQLAEYQQQNGDLTTQVEDLNAEKQNLTVTLNERQTEIATLQHQMDNQNTAVVNPVLSVPADMTVKKYLMDHYLRKLESPNLRMVLMSAILILILLLIWLLWTFSLRRRMHEPTIEESDDHSPPMQNSRKGNNYHYLSGEDPVRTKLDLARAYIDMDDYQRAKVILKEVLKEADDEHCKEAEALLKKISS